VCNTETLTTSVPGALVRPGTFAFPGAVIVRPTRGDGFITTAEAARLVGRKPVTIRQWRRRGWLLPQGLDERGYPLHTRQAVRDAERKVRENGLETSGIDPRQLCGRGRSASADEAA